MITCKVLSNILGQFTTTFVMKQILASLFLQQHTSNLFTGINYEYIIYFYICSTILTLLQLCIMICIFSRYHSVTQYNTVCKTVSHFLIQNQSKELSQRVTLPCIKYVKHWIYHSMPWKTYHKGWMNLSYHSVSFS